MDSTKKKRKVAPKKLTSAQQAFVNYIIAGDTQVAALYKAYPNSLNWSYEVQKKRASEIANTPTVKARLAKRRDRIAERNEMTLDETLRNMANWVRFNPKSILSGDGCIKQLEDMTDEEAACIQSFEMEEIWAGRGDDRTQIGVLKKVKLIDKRATADMFMRKFGAYLDRHVHSIEDLDHIKDVLNQIDE